MQEVRKHNSFISSSEMVQGKFIKRFLLFLLPLFLVMGIYVMLDPFKVLWYYEDYFPMQEARVDLNNGFVSIENFDNHREEFHWDSYILGSSRSRFWYVEDWMQYLPTGSRPYHCDASTECLTGLRTKIEYIDKSGEKLNNALVILDKSLIAQVDAVEGHLFALPPKTVSYDNWLKFHSGFVKAFLDFGFLTTYFKYLITGEYVESMKQHLNPDLSNYDYKSNEYYLKYEKKIVDGFYYTPQLLEELKSNQHPDSISPVCIGEEQIRQFNIIKSIFVRHHTDYKIIISPLQNQIRLNPIDVAKLQNLFGKDKVFDFSGRNEMTDEFHNYYETSHYRPCVAEKMLELIYR